MGISEAPDWIFWMAASFFGYLVGSISFARILHRILRPGERLEEFKFELPGSDKPFESNMVSATSVGMRLGRKFGCATSLLDILKVAIPTFLVKLLFPEQPYYYLTALLGIVGHNFPIYHRFAGGRGDSPILGAILIINWFGILIANAAAMVLGYLLGSVMVMRLGGHLLCIIWFWIYFDDYQPVVFMILANILFWLSTSRDLKRFKKLIRENKIEINEEFLSEAMLMGRSVGRFLDRYGFPAILKKLLSKMVKG